MSVRQITTFLLYFFQDEIRHLGDLGNIIAGIDNVAKFEMTDNMIKLMGRHSIIGRMLIVHKMADNLGKKSQK